MVASTSLNFMLSPTLSLLLQEVKKGTFLMGSEGEEAYGDEQPEHQVHISQGYYVAQFPITQAQWAAVMNGHRPARFNGPGRPVEQVSWLDIVQGGQDETVPEAFLTRLNNQLGDQINLPGYTFRLPTEAEWEYAAKGGHLARTLPEQKVRAADYYTRYAGSDKLKEVAWHSSNSHGETKKVGLKRPNELGLYDMCGNVWEWCHDGLSGSDYEARAKRGLTVDPQGPDEGQYRVLRGGSWVNGAQGCRLAYRFNYHPTLRLNFIGFRVVLAPSLAELASNAAEME